MTLYKYCRRCGKRLKGEENRLRGYGKICYEKAKKEAQGIAPLITPPKEQVKKELKRLEAEEQKARAEAEELSRARARLQARQAQGSESRAKAEQKSSKRKSSEPRPPHLEKTLTPTYKKPFLFTPPSLPHPQDR